MFFVLVAFFAPIFGATCCIIESRLSNYTFKRQTTMIFYVSVMNCVFLPLTLVFGMPTIPSITALLCYIVLASIDVLYLYPFYTALKVIDSSIVSALFSLGQITIPIMSFLFLGEVLSLPQYIGFVVIIMASIALSIKGNKIPKLSRAFYYMAFASLLRAGYAIVEKYVLIEDQNWVNMVVYPTFISGVIPFLFLLRKNWRKDIIKSFPPYMDKVQWFVLNEFFWFAEAVAQIYGMSGLSPVVSVSIGATEPIFLLGFSYFLLKKYNIPLKEKISSRLLVKKMFCFVLIILGLILVVGR